ncbi:hypothetical protein [Sphaerothrix gracilis]|uniref:hypothetical protein n=1 Tax=Sphaerothrix gracilis TaxID=3151835 RepID=UPI0031FC7E44
MKEDVGKQLSSVSVMPAPAAGSSYLVTLCTHKRESLFGGSSSSVIELNQLGEIAADEWVRSAARHREIQLDQWIVRPDCIQGIILVKSTITLDGTNRHRSLTVSKPRALSAFVAGFKAAAAKRINLLRNQPGSPVWERSYQDQKIADVRDLNRLRQRLEPMAFPFYSY